MKGKSVFFFLPFVHRLAVFRLSFWNPDVRVDGANLLERPLGALVQTLLVIELS